MEIRVRLMEFHGTVIWIKINSRGGEMQALHNKGWIMKQTSLPGLEYASFHSST